MFGKIVNNLLGFICAADRVMFTERRACQGGGVFGENYGSWMGTVGDMKETITFNANGTFISQLPPRNSLAIHLAGASRARLVELGQSKVSL